MNTNIREYAALMVEYGLSAIEIKGDAQEIRLERNVSSTTAKTPEKQREDAESRSLFTRSEKKSGDMICSPMVGVFYAAPSENAEPFIKVGCAVKKGDVLCVIEAMKLMNEIKAEADGTVAEIYAANGEAVEFGQPLFRITP